MDVCHSGRKMTSKQAYVRTWATKIQESKQPNYLNNSNYECKKASNYERK